MPKYKYKHKNIQLYAQVRTYHHIPIHKNTIFQQLQRLVGRHQRHEERKDRNGRMRGGGGEKWRDDRWRGKKWRDERWRGKNGGMRGGGREKCRDERWRGEKCHQTLRIQFPWAVSPQNCTLIMVQFTRPASEASLGRLPSRRERVPDGEVISTERSPRQMLLRLTVTYGDRGGGGGIPASIHPMEKVHQQHREGFKFNFMKNASIATNFIFLTKCPS